MRTFLYVCLLWFGIKICRSLLRLAAEEYPDIRRRDESHDYFRIAVLIGLILWVAWLLHI